MACGWCAGSSCSGDKGVWHSRRCDACALSHKLHLQSLAECLLLKCLSCGSELPLCTLLFPQVQPASHIPLEYLMNERQLKGLLFNPLAWLVACLIHMRRALNTSQILFQNRLVRAQLHGGSPLSQMCVIRKWYSRATQQ
jgi:hypothetical protein